MSPYDGYSGELHLFTVTCAVSGALTNAFLFYVMADARIARNYDDIITVLNEGVLGNHTSAQ